MSIGKFKLFVKIIYSADEEARCLRLIACQLAGNGYSRINGQLYNAQTVKIILAA